MEKDPGTHSTIGASMEVHKIIGPGHLKAVYYECLEIEFKEQKIPFISRPKVKIYYKGKESTKYYIPDFIVYDKEL